MQYVCGGNSLTHVTVLMSSFSSLNLGGEEMPCNTPTRKICSQFYLLSSISQFKWLQTITSTL